MVSYTIAGKHYGWTSFTTLPFFRADLYNITLTKQNILGSPTIATFSNSRFTITKTKYGINIISDDKDVNNWVEAGAIYEFDFDFTKNQ